MTNQDLYSAYLWAYGLKKADDTEAASNLVTHAHGRGAKYQFAVALGLRDACEEEYDAESDSTNDSIFNFEGFSAAIDLAFETF